MCFVYHIHFIFISIVAKLSPGGNNTRTTGRIEPKTYISEQNVWIVDFPTGIFQRQFCTWIFPHAFSNMNFSEGIFPNTLFATLIFPQKFSPVGILSHKISHKNFYTITFAQIFPQKSFHMFLKFTTLWDITKQKWKKKKKNTEVCLFVYPLFSSFRCFHSTRNGF